jgi:hypothetical protein
MFFEYDVESMRDKEGKTGYVDFVPAVAGSVIYGGDKDGLVIEPRDMNGDWTKSGTGIIKADFLEGANRLSGREPDP